MITMISKIITLKKIFVENKFIEYKNLTLKTNVVQIIVQFGSS